MSGHPRGRGVKPTASSRKAAIPGTTGKGGAASAVPPPGTAYIAVPVLGPNGPTAPSGSRKGLSGGAPHQGVERDVKARLWSPRLDVEHPRFGSFVDLGIKVRGNYLEVAGYGRFPVPNPSHDYRRESLGELLRDYFSVTTERRRKPLAPHKPLPVAPTPLKENWDDDDDEGDDGSESSVTTVTAPVTTVLSTQPQVHVAHVQTNLPAPITATQQYTVGVAPLSVTVPLASPTPSIEEWTLGAVNRYIDRSGGSGLVIDVGAGPAGTKRHIRRDWSKLKSVKKVHCLCPPLSNKDLLDAWELPFDSAGATKNPMVTGCRTRLSDCPCVVGERVYFARQSQYYWTEADYRAMPVGSRLFSILNRFVGEEGVISSHKWSRNGEWIVSVPLEGVGDAYAHRDLNSFIDGKPLDFGDLFVIPRVIHVDGDVVVVEALVSKVVFPSVVTAREATPVVSLAAPDVAIKIPPIDRNSYEGAIQRHAAQYDPAKSAEARAAQLQQSITAIRSAFPSQPWDKVQTDLLDQVGAAQRDARVPVAKFVASTNAWHQAYQVAIQGGKYPHFPFRFPRMVYLVALVWLCFSIAAVEMIGFAYAASWLLLSGLLNMALVAIHFRDRYGLKFGIPVKWTRAQEAWMQGRPVYKQIGHTSSIRV